MKIVEEIKNPIQKEMELFEKKFKDSMLSKAPLLNRITYYIVRRKIGRAHVRTPVTRGSRMPSSA